VTRVDAESGGGVTRKGEGISIRFSRKDEHTETPRTLKTIGGPLARKVHRGEKTLRQPKRPPGKVRGRRRDRWTRVSERWKLAKAQVRQREERGVRGKRKKDKGVARRVGSKKGAVVLENDFP